MIFIKEKLLNAYDKCVIMVKTKIKKDEEKEFQELYKNKPLTEAQKKEIDSYYEKYYGKKISHVWHQYYTAESGVFDKRYFPEDLYIPKCEHFMNENVEYCKVFEDKNMLKLIASAAGVKTPKTILSCAEGVYQDGQGSLMSRECAISYLKSLEGKKFIKASKSSYGGKSCSVFDCEDDIENILNKYGKNFVIQVPIKCSKEISALHPESVNTFRIITYIWNNKIYNMKPSIRIGRGDSIVDNVSSGGFSVGIDESGNLKPFATFSKIGRIYEHPDTKIVFEGYHIPGFDKVLKAAVKLHQQIPQIGIINWDFTIDDSNEPVLIEMNITGGSIDLCQTHGESAFGDNTEEILCWVSEREKMNKIERLQRGRF